MSRAAVAIVLGLLVLAACTPSSAPQAEASPTPAVLRGELPVQDLSSTDPGHNEFHGGFLHFPGATYVKDPRADISVDPTRTQLRKTAVEPSLFGSAVGDELSSAITYDRPAGRWLPAARNQVSPDGLSYAYTEWILSGSGALGPSPVGGRIHVVDIPSAADRVVYSFSGNVYFSVVGLTNRGIYFSPGCFGAPAGPQCGPEALKLWRLDAATDIAVKVSDRRGQWTIAGATAWMVTVPETGDQPNQLLRLNLATGSEEIWDREPVTPHEAGSCCWSIRIAGIGADGLPMLVTPGTDESTLLRVSRPGHTDRIFAAPGCCYDALADAHGTWFGVVGGAVQGIYLYSPTSGLRKLTDLAGVPVGMLS